MRSRIFIATCHNNSSYLTTTGAESNRLNSPLPDKKQYLTRYGKPDYKCSTVGAPITIIYYTVT